MKIFLPGCDAFNTNDFNGVITDLDIHHQCINKNIFKYFEIFKLSEKLKHITNK